MEVEEHENNELFEGLYIEEIQGYPLAMKAFVFEKNKFQKRLFWLSNFLGAAILNNCDVTWLPYCSRTIALCIRTIGQPSYVTIIQDGGAREI